MSYNGITDFAGRTALVTGAGSGIGLAIARELAGHGANVIAADIELDAAESAAAELRGLGVRALGVACDVSSREEVARLGAAAREWGGLVSVLCNNAGVSIGRWGIHASPADWDWVLGVNLWGVIHGIEEFLPDMLASGEDCHVLNTASMNGFFPSARSALYSTSKYAVIGLTETMRDELRGTRVGISALCPSPVSTGIFASDTHRPDRLGATGDPDAKIGNFDSAKELSPPLRPEAVGPLVMAGLRDNRAFIFTDPLTRRLIEERNERMLADFAALDQSSFSDA